MNLPSAIRILISTYLADMNIFNQQAPTAKKTRARAERRFGEDITNGNLEKLKKKDEIKKIKALKQKSVQQSQRASKKKN